MHSKFEFQTLKLFQFSQRVYQLATILFDSSLVLYQNESSEMTDKHRQIAWETEIKTKKTGPDCVH